MTDEFMASPAHDADLWQLLAALCDESLDAPQRDRLEAILTADADARRFCAAYLDQHAQMLWLYRDAPEASSPRKTDAAADETSEPANTNLTSEAARSPLLGFLADHWQSIGGSSRTLALALGGLLVGYFVIVFALIPLTRWAASGRPQHPAVVPGAAAETQSAGQLITHGDTHWASHKAPAAGNVARIGERCELTAGRATLRLAQGTCLVIEGPASWRLESDARLQLDAGRLAAYVPTAAIGFAVVTPCAEVVDLGTEFGVEVQDDGRTEVHVVRGKVSVSQIAGENGASRRVALGAGEAVRVSAVTGTSDATFDQIRFEAALELAAEASRVGDAPGSVSTVWLGNLFDDHPHVPLADAMRTDTFRAEADFNDLGVDHVNYGGAALQQIAPDLWFDFKTAGWTGLAAHRIANDAWTSLPGDGAGRAYGGGIRLQGKPLAWDAAKLEEGIGMHADALLTFNLDDIRAAGKLSNARLKFVCDRAGVNDGAFGMGSSVHMLVLVSTATSVETALVDGKPAKLAERDGHWSIASPIGEPLRPDGHFATFLVPLPHSARYLTLATTASGDNISMDHAVWIGARLEVDR